MAWCLLRGYHTFGVFDQGTVDHARYIEEVLPLALEYGDKTFGDHCTFQHDGAKPHIHHLTQQWCRDNFSSFIDQDCWPPNTSDLNPFDYCIWDELANGMNWHRISTKTGLVDELKQATRKVRFVVVFESCRSWTARLKKVYRNDGR